MSIQALYNKTMTISAQGYTENAIKERVETKTTVATNVKCRLDVLSGKDSIFMDNINAYITVRIWCDYRNDFENWDYLTVDGVEYKIYQVIPCYTKANYNCHHLELDCYVEKRL